MEFNHNFLGILWGILMASQDLNIYLLYTLLLISSTKTVICNNFLTYYDLFCFCSTFLTAVFYPISGWITDNTSDNSSKVFLVTNIIQLSLVFLQGIPYFLSWETNGWIPLYICWQLYQLVSIQNSNSLWKIIKKFTDNHPEGLVMVNKIGNVGDLTSDISETTILTVLIVLILFVKNYIINYEFVVLYLFIIISIFNIVLCIISIFMLKSDIVRYTPLNQVNSISVYSDNDNQNSDNIVKPSKIKQCFNWLRTSIIEFWQNKIAFHAFWHCIILTTFTTVVQYPLSLKEVSIVVQSNDKTINNYCGGIIINLLFLGALTNGCYLIGSISYRLFIIKTVPLIFYKYWYPICSIFLLGITTCLWFNFNQILTYIFISFSLIIPYYLTYYDYYLFTDRSAKQWYGFVLGLYGLVNTITTLAIQGIYMLTIPFYILLIFNGILLILSIIYSFYIVYIIRRDGQIFYL